MSEVNDQEFREKMIASVTRIETLLSSQDQRLWGHDGQPGVIPHLYTQLADTKKEFNLQIKAVEDTQTAMDKQLSITTWKLGSMSAGLGALLTLGIQFIIKKIFHLGA